VLPEREKAMRYLRDVIRVDPKLYGKRISRDDILEILRENKKLQNGARVSKKLEDAIKAIIGRHNASFTKQNINKYRKGKNMFSLTFKAVVWNEQLEHEYVDDVTIGFYSDLTYEQMTKEIIEEIVEIYYADRDYPDFIRLLDYVLTLIAKDKNILEMKLLDVICGKKYRSNYIRSYKDLVEGYDEKEHDGKCLNIMLQTNYKPLVDQRLIPREKLTDKYIDEYFGDDRTIKRLLEFVKELKHASIYVFDQIGKELIASHKATNEKVTASAIALVGDHHIECITDSMLKGR
jgi:hypothetical protein